jgi:uncharacterized repeat protein (TIGR01451 family)
MTTVETPDLVIAQTLLIVDDDYNLGASLGDALVGPGRDMIVCPDRSNRKRGSKGSMRQCFHAVRFLLVTLACAAAFAATPTTIPPSVPGEILLKFEASASTQEIADVQHGNDIDHGERISNTRSGAIWRMHSRSLNTAALSNALQKNPKILYVEPNYIIHLTDTPNDPSYSQLWGLKNTGQVINGSTGTAGSDIRAESAWGVTKGSAAIIVGVVDTGVDYTHTDLAANIWSNPGGKGNAICAAGTHGYNAITKTCDPMDDHYHGTHVSGTIGAAGNNGVGVVGVNWIASIMGLKFLDSQGYGTTADAITAIDFAVQAKIDGVNVRVLSNSWGGGGFSKALLDEINKANENDILFVASAGNDSSSIDTYPSYPASYNTLNMIAVAATDNRDTLAYFSNYGVNSVHLGAPGVSVFSTTPGSSYSFLSGTSMAVPHVSGVAALVLAKTPALTTAQVKSAILDNTDPISSLSGKTITGGRLNAAKAVGAPPLPDFAVSASPSSRTVAQGGATSYTVTITPSNGFAGSVDLSVTGLPAGASGTFTPTPATTSSTLSVTASGTASLSSNTLTITGTSGALIHSTTATLVIVTTPPVTACPSFMSPFVYYIGSSATTLATGDFNRDGKADIALAFASSNQVMVVTGRGDGGYQSTVSYAVGTAPVSVAIGDFNRDGKPDIATANAVSGNVSILLGNGDGTFQAAVNYTAGASPFWLAVGDFNGDGKPDLAVANNGSNDVSILAGQGDGTFQTAVNYAAGSGPYAVTIGDFNGDGRADLAVVDSHANNISILLGNGDATFLTAVSYAVGSHPSSIAVGDFNGDGKTDLAVSNDVSNSVSVLAGVGDGTFQAAVNYAVPNGQHSIVIVDINRDGKPDLVVSNSTSNNVSILAGKGDGTFFASVNYAAGTSPYQVAVGDFNGDGRADLVTNGDPYYYSVLLNNGVCSLNCNTISPAVNYTVGSSPSSVAAGDFNSDGQPDLAIVNNGANNVSIELGNGNGTFQPPSTVNPGSAPLSAVVGDFNGDGKADIAVANDGSNDLSILLGNGDGTFHAAVNYASGSHPHFAAARDFNRDGKVDLAVANSGSDNVSILLGNGNGTFQAAVNYGAGSSPESIAIGDFNRDGKPDLAVANSGSNLSILLGNGDGTFQTATSVAAGTSPFFVMTADFNRDGITDLAVANSASNNVSILLGNGNGTFHPAVNYSVGTNPHSLTAEDFNDDGILDLAVANVGSNNVTILLGSGNGAFFGPSNSAAGTGPSSLVARDFDRDGKPDLAVVNSGSNNLSILINTCPAPDLTVTKTHAASFAQGDSGKIYTITVSNVGNAATSSVVSVTDTLPVGLSASAMSGTGWNCNLQTVTCTRSDALSAGTSYQPISLTVNVSNTAPASVTNAASVSGGGEVNTSNNSASDPTTITAVTDLIIASSHSGNFTQGDTGKTYRIVARNAGRSPTSGTVTVTDSLPAGLTATQIAGTGWTCVLNTLTCTRGDVLAGSTSYPIITVTVNVAASATSPVTNTVTVSGGGEANTTNDTANDPTIVWSSQTCGSFAGPVKYSTGSGTYALATGDFNRDGKPDVAVVNQYSNTVSILLGNGDGTLAPAVNYNVGNDPFSIAVVDLNNDGKPDLAVVNYYSNGLSILLGNGDGTFGAARNYFNLSTYPGTVAVGDFNGDGNADLVVGNGTYYDNKVSVFLGNGNGTLQAPIRYAAGYGPYSIVVADFNGDGKADFATTGYNSNGLVSIVLGNGDGTFQAPIAYGVGTTTQYVSVGDFNGDGKPDLAVTKYYSGSLSIFIGNGDGTFQTGVNYQAGYGGNFMAIDDVNGDGKADIAVASSYSNTISILLGNGNGTFQPPVNYAAGSGPIQVAISDFNGDGKADLVVTDGYEYKVAVLLGGCPDLTIVKSHTGNFIGGQTNAIYSLMVSNTGGTTQGTVTVTDALPAGLTATAMSGPGWTCDQPTLTCTRSDSLGGGASYPFVSLTVSVSKTAAATVTNTATVSGGGDTNLANNSANDPTTIVQASDLTITKTHDGSFAQGQIGRTYTITIANAGGASTSGTVTVTDIVPTGITPTAMTGPGWNCDLASRTCSRNDALAAAGTYPPITLTVNVDNNAPSSLTNTAVVSGGGEAFFANDTANDLTRIIATPTNLVATAISTSQVSLTWTSVVNATSYQVLRSSGNGPYAIVATPISNSFIDPSLTPNTTYLYRVRAVDTSAVGPPSNVDIATTIFFTDDPIVPGSTTIKAVHVTELRTAVNAVRAAAGLPPSTFSDASLDAGFLVQAVHVTELRSSLDAARAALGLPAMVYTDSTLGAQTVIKASHVRDLRAGVQ